MDQVDAPPERRIVFRIGINLGDVVVEGDDLLGDGVNVAARLEQLCPAGGVLISGTAYDQMKGKLGLPLDFTGEQRVKNISEPVRTYSVRMDGVKRGWRLTARRFRKWLPIAAVLLPVLVIAGAGIWLFGPAETAAGKPAVAVLPFNNYGGDAAGDRLADGLTEDVITDLARFSDMDVVARNSTEVYRDKPADLREIAKALHVGYVLEGSIQHEAGRVRITAQLIDATSGIHLWSERWDRPDEDVFAVQTEIAQHVANQLGGGAGLIRQAGREAARRKRPEHLTAYELYLLGSEKLEQQNPASLKEGVRLLTRAVELDPSLARAWTQLFHGYDVLAYSGVDPEKSRKMAAEAAERAVSVDPNDPYAHVALGYSFGAQNDFIRAEAEFDTALRLAPGSAEVLTNYASWAATFGEPKQGGEMADQARRLDPNYPMWAAGRFSYAYFAADRYEDALGVLDGTIPDNYTKDMWVVRSGALAALGRVEEAKNWVQEALKRFPSLTTEGWSNEPGYSEAERQRFIRTMQLAGFPPCAKPKELARFAKPIRLPECMNG